MTGLAISGTQVPAWMALSIGVAAVLYRDSRAGRGTVLGRIRVAPFITAAILFCLTAPGGAAQIDSSTNTVSPWCAQTEPAVDPTPMMLWGQRVDDLGNIDPLQTKDYSQLLSLVSLELGESGLVGTMLGLSPQGLAIGGRGLESSSSWDTLAPGASRIEKPQHGNMHHGKTRPYSCSSPRK